MASAGVARGSTSLRVDAQFDFMRRSQEAVQSIKVVDDAPPAAALLDLGAPSFEPREVFARVEIVRAQLRYVECHDLEAFKIERNVAHIALGQVLFHI